MGKPLNKAGKKLVKKKTKDGRVRAYWVGQKEGQKRLRQAAPEKQSFLAKHGGKLLAGAALAGAVALNRHKLAGAVRGAGLAHNAIKHSGEKVGLADRARSMMRMAKVGYMSNRGMDRIDPHMDRLKSGLRQTAAGMTRDALSQKATNWRRTAGAGLAHHLATVGGQAAAEHLGSRFGQVAGTSIGGLFGGPTGAAVGSFIGGHAGQYLGGRHAAPHIARGADWLARRMQR